VPHATPGPAGATSTESGAVRTYRRSLGMRIVSAACAVLFLGGAISLARAAGATAGLLILGALAALSLINLAGAFADRYTLDDEGIEYRNALLALLGRAPRRVAWDEIADVREHHRLRASGGGPPSALFLTLRSARRLVPA